MSDVCYITCPECDDEFKSTTDKEGKKIRCPECDEPFKVTAKLIRLPKKAKEAVKAAKPAPAPAPEPPPPPPPPPPPVATATASDDDEEEGNNPYGMTEVKVAARCPSCANELLSEKDIICVTCGYNLLTREVGVTKKIIESTGQDQLKHLAPALSALGFAVFVLVAMLYFDLILPPTFRETNWFGFLDSEPIRLFLSVIACFLIYSAGSFGLNVIVFTPKPKEREKE